MNSEPQTIAIVALMISSVALVWNIVQWSLDQFLLYRPRLSVTSELLVDSRTNERLLALRVINRGRVNVRLTTFGFLVENDEFVTPLQIAPGSNEIPYMLPARDDANWFFATESINNEELDLIAAGKPFVVPVIGRRVKGHWQLKGSWKRFIGLPPKPELRNVVNSAES